jgi:hypothetical protein
VSSSRRAIAASAPRELWSGGLCIGLPPKRSLLLARVRARSAMSA